MMDTKITQALEGLEPTLVELLNRWIAVPSVKAEAAPGAPFGAEVRRMLDTAMADIRALGFPVKDYDGYACDAEMGQGEETIAVLGHLDVVPAGDGWQTPPFTPVREGDRIYGRGTSDDKGPVIAALVAMKALALAGVPLKKKIRLILGCDEESGWEDMAYYAAHARMPEVGFSPDASFPVINTEKGMIQFHLKAKAAATGMQVKRWVTGERMNVIPGVAQALLGIVNPGDEVIVLAPYFASYAQQIELAGGVVVEVPTYEENAYRPDEQELRRVITSRTRAIIINTPCNPTGAAYDRDTLEMLAGIAKEFDLLALADEIYLEPLVADTVRRIIVKEKPDGLLATRTLPGMAERTVTLNSFSKNFLMTGWRVGVVIAPAELISVFQFISNALTYTAPSISQRAAIRALALRHQIAEEYICKFSFCFPPENDIYCFFMHPNA